MKKKIFTTLFLLLFIGSHAYAADNPAEKLGRGVVNVVTAPGEIPKQIRVYWKEGAKKTDHILVWIFSGFVKGLVETTKRAGSGVWDVLTFPVEVPQDYEPLVKPEFVFQNDTE